MLFLLAKTTMVKFRSPTDVTYMAVVTHMNDTLEMIRQIHSKWYDSYSTMEQDPMLTSRSRVDGNAVIDTIGM